MQPPPGGRGAGEPALSAIRACGRGVAGRGRTGLRLLDLVLVSPEALTAPRGRLLANHQLKLVVADNLPLVYVDSVLIERALGHLIENAVKFSAPSLPIEVSAGRVDRMIRFAVRDEGVGLSADERDHIWERLYRGPRHAAIGGSGLGLSIARALVTGRG